MCVNPYGGTGNGLPAFWYSTVLRLILLAVLRSKESITPHAYLGSRPCFMAAHQYKRPCIFGTLGRKFSARNPLYWGKVIESRNPVGLIRPEDSLDVKCYFLRMCRLRLIKRMRVSVPQERNLLILLIFSILKSVSLLRNQILSTS